MKARHALLATVVAAPLWLRQRQFEREVAKAHKQREAELKDFADRLNRSWTAYAAELNARFRELTRTIR